LFTKKEGFKRSYKKVSPDFIGGYLWLSKKCLMHFFETSRSRRDAAQPSGFATDRGGSGNFFDAHVVKKML